MDNRKPQTGSFPQRLGGKIGVKNMIHDSGDIPARYLLWKGSNTHPGVNISWDQVSLLLSTLSDAPFVFHGMVGIGTKIHDNFMDFRGVACHINIVI